MAMSNMPMQNCIRKKTFNYTTNSNGVIKIPDLTVRDHVVISARTTNADTIVVIPFSIKSANAWACKCISSESTNPNNNNLDFEVYYIDV